MSDNTLRARFFSRSLLRSIAAEELIASGREASAAVVRDPFIDEAPILSASAWLRSRKVVTPPR